MTILTCDQLGARFEGAARFIAAVLVAVYVAGATLRDTLQGFASWTQRLIEAPLQTLIDLIPTVEPQPALFTTKDLLKFWEAEILEPEALEAEIQAYDAKQSVARRKPAKARKAAVAA